MKLVYAYITYIFLNCIVYTIFGVAHAALLARMTRDFKDRNTTSTVSSICNNAAGLAVVCAAHGRGEVSARDPRRSGREEAHRSHVIEFIQIRFMFPIQLGQSKSGRQARFPAVPAILFKPVPSTSPAMAWTTGTSTSTPPSTPSARSGGMKPTARCTKTSLRRAA